MRRAIFLDKDGTLIPDIPYNCDPARITLSDQSVEGLRSLASAGFLLIIVSNQAGIALDYFTEEELEGALAKLRDLLNNIGVSVAGIYYCPHHPEAKHAKYQQECDCRKPLPGLLLRAAQEQSIDLTQSWMIGDILNDIEAGNRAGCRSILIDNGNETEWLNGELRRPAFICKNINEAADYIYNQEYSHESLETLP